MRARSVAVALLTCLLATSISLADDPQGTLTERRSGLVWVADPQFAVSSGFANGVVLSRPRALRMVARMNAGRLPNFGRTDWRLPTQRELARFVRRQGGGSLPDPRSGKVRVWPVAGAATLPGIADVAVLGTNSVRLSRDSRVTGDVVANDASPGPTLEGTVELKLDRNSQVLGDVKGDSIRLDQQSSVTGDATYNTLSNGGSIGGVTSSPLALPVFPLLPVFQSSSPRAGSADVFVGAGETATLAAGEYGSIQVAAGGTLVLAGGVYEVDGVALDGDCAFPCSSVEAAAGADLRIAQRLAIGPGSFLGPQAGSGITAADVVVYVGGINGTTGALDALPVAAEVRRGSRIEANLYAPNGTIHFERDGTGAGAFFARDVLLDQNTTLDLASYFVNHPPVAFPVTAFTHGTAPITITLRGADPDADDLTFSIVAGSGPANGTLGPVVQAPPPVPPGDPERPQGDPPRTEATVAYTPSGGGDLEDGFSFRVTDTSGASGTAIVTINPPASETPPPPDPETVVANDTADTTTTDRPVTLTLTGGAPAGVAISFAILPGTGPSSGELGTLVQGSESPQRSASVVYTPDAGFEGVDGFQFTACGLIAEVETCDTGAATIQVDPPVVEPGEIAPDQSVATPQNTPVTVNLGSLSGSTGGLVASSSGLRFVAGKAIALDPAEIAGNVADADEDGFGDNHNNLPGAVPGLISAGVDQSGGAGSNGTVRIHAEWDISFMTAPITGETTAQIQLTTNRGTVDSRDTFFFAGPGGNGTLEDGDFEAADGFEQLAGVVMPVSGLVGADGTFSFDIRGPLNDAIAAGADFFTVQGRVDESLTGPARGLQVYSSASGNTSTLPALILTSPPPLPPTTYEILSLPAGGVLFDGTTQITAVPYTLGGSTLSYAPNVGFLGTDTFSYRATFGEIIDTGLVTIVVQFVDCGTNVADCDDGRD